MEGQGHAEGFCALCLPMEDPPILLYNLWSILLSCFPRVQKRVAVPTPRFWALNAGPTLSPVPYLVDCGLPPWKVGFFSVASRFSAESD